MTTLPGLADADIFEDNIRNVLDRIQNQVPKSFVNLVALFNVRQSFFFFFFIRKAGVTFFF